MYDVHMKRFNTAAFRANLAQALDEAEHGVTVIVERKGVRFRVVPERAAPASRRAAPLFEVIDPALLDGQWGWELGSAGGAMRFLADKRRRSRA